MASIPSTTPTTFRASRGSRLSTTLEILMVTACLALGAGFVSSLWPDSTPASAEAAAHTCPQGAVKC